MAFGGRPPHGPPWSSQCGGGRPSVEEMLAFQYMMTESVGRVQCQMGMALSAAGAGEHALTEGKYDEAEHLLQKAYSIYHELPHDVEEDLSKVVQNLIILHQKRGWYQMAMQNVAELHELKPYCFHTSWLSATTFVLLRELDNALSCFCTCLPLDNISQKQKVDCLVEICQLALKVKDNLLVESISAPPSIWRKVIKRLYNDRKWDAVCMLMGLSSTHYTSLDGVGKGCGAEGINVGALLCVLGGLALANWGQKLAIALIEDGASVDSVRIKPEDQPLHVALRLGLHSGSFQLLKYQLEKLPSDCAERNQVDVNGDSMFHMVVKSGKANTTVGETAVRLLLNHGCRPDIPDMEGKLTVGYLNSTDQVYTLLKCAPQPWANGSRPTQLIAGHGDLLKKLDVLRERGKDCMRKQAYREALRQYSEGIQLAARPGTLNHELAILYSNRSAVYSKLGNLKAALKDAEACITISPAWPKGYWRKGQVLKSQKRHIEAFLIFHQGFECKMNTEECELCLTEAVSAISKIKDYKKFTRRLEHLDKDVISAVIQRLCKQSDWLATSVLVLGRGKSQPVSKIATGASAVGVELRRLVTLAEGMDERVSWPFDLICALLTLGASHLTMVTDEKDTPYHVAVRLVLKMDEILLLDMLLKCWDNQEKARVSVNGKRENLLHTLTKSRKTDGEIGAVVAEILLWIGVDPQSKDQQGKVPVDYLPLNSELRHMFSKSNTSVKVRKEVSKQGSNKTRSKSGPKKPPKDPCAICMSELSAARHLHMKNRTGPAVESLCKIISDQSHNSEKHRQLYKEAIDEIVVIFEKTFRPEVPKAMLKLPEAVCKTIVCKLAQKNQWQQVETLISTWRRGNPMMTTIATGLCVGDVIGCTSLQGNPMFRREVISVLLKNGGCLQASPEVTDEPISKAIANKDYRVIAVLLQYGAQPKRIRLATGDTPLHVALKVALELDKGYFELFERLLDMYDNDKVTYKYLDPSTVDKSGTSLYHLAARCKYSPHAQKAVELLCGRRVAGRVKDCTGRTPLDYISKQSDRRREYLRMASLFDGPSRKVSTSSTTSHSVRPEAKKQAQVATLVEQGEETVEVEEAVQEVKVVKPAKSKKEQVKEFIKQYIEGLSECMLKKNEGIGTNTAREGEREQAGDVESDNMHTKPDVKEKSSTVVEESDNDVEMRPDVQPKSNGEESVIVEVISPCAPVDGGGDRLPDRVELVSPESSSDEEIEFTNETDDDINAEVFDDLEWEVECTAEVWKFLKNKHMPMYMKQRVIKRIQQLARGEWTDSLTKQVHNVPETLLLFEAKISKGSRIIWERAVAFSPKLSEKNYTDITVDQTGQSQGETIQIYSEVIRVWDIVLAHDKLYHRIQRVARSHARGRDSIIRQKLTRISNQLPTVTVNVKYCIPELFTLSAENSGEVMPFFPPASPSEKEYHIVKFYSFSSALVNHILKQTETKVDFPFKVTDMEHAIISLQPGAPLLLLGRSGTGKTTCCLYRLWHSYLSYWTRAYLANDPLLPRSVHFMKTLTSIPEAEDSCDNEDSDDSDAENDASEEQSEEGSGSDENTDDSGMLDHLQQIFVTKNPVLCSEVMKNFCELSHACNVSEYSETSDDNPLPNKLQDVPYQMYPLFLTSQQLLLLLDASLPGKAFFERSEDGSLKRSIKGWTDADSPLAFISELDSDSEVEDEDVDTNMISIQSASHADPRREVTYQIFAEELWPKMKKKFGYHPSLIWTEINSFIKGSFEALHSLKGHLTLEEYQELGRKRASNFTGERSKVYQIFKCYEHVKRQKGLFDECDLLIDMYKRLRKTVRLDWVIHQIYVDETQDFTQAELCLLIGLCQNPNEMFFTGDTAQGIMRGISFRFNDLKSLFFYAQDALRTIGKEKAVKVPDRVYQLTHNYRSHAGILAMASSIVDLMVDFFPETFDHLGKDQGLFHGPLPLLLESCSFSDLAVLLRGNRRQTSEIEFGAHQAILVVNDAARMALPEELRVGLVLTIFEAKGLEFDDVLLYNFFKDSQARKEWRVVTEYLQRLSESNMSNMSSVTSSAQGLIELDVEAMQSSSCRPLTFSPDQHKVLCSELKHLYTALTRARVNVWLFDEDVDNRAPMFHYFKARRLVRTITADGNSSEGITDEMFAEASSSSDWVKRGDDFMKHHLYEVAAKCYKRAEVRQKENIALAHATALRATRLQDTPLRMREEFLHAAEQYLVCGMKNEAARCLKNAKERLLAAKLFEKMGEMEKAGSLYKLCNMPYDASRCYERQGLYRQAITLLCDMQSYDKAIDVLNRYQMEMKEFSSQGKPLPKGRILNRPSKEQTMDHLTYKAAGFHLKSNNEQKMLASLARLQAEDDRIVFLMKHGRPLLAVEMLKKKGHYYQGAKILLDEGKYTEGVQCAELAKDDALVSHCLLASCRKKILEEDLITLEPSAEQLEEREHVCGSLRRVQTYFSNVGDMNEVSEIKLMLGQLKRDADMVKEAWRLFGQLRPAANEAGQVECSKALLTMINLKENSEACYTFASKDIACLLTILRIIRNPSNIKEQEKVKLYERYYGLKREEAGSLVFYPKHYPKCRIFLRNYIDDSRVKNSMDSCDVLEQLQRYLLESVQLWVLELQFNIENILTANTKCPSLVEGKPCNQPQTCKRLHQPHTKTTFWNAFYCHLTQAHIDSNILNTCSLVRDVKVKRKLRPLVPSDNSPFDNLIKFLVPLGAQWKLFHREWQLLRCVFERLNVPELRDNVKQWQAFYWRNLSYQKKISTTSVYVDGCFHCAIFLSSITQIDTWMKESERKTSEKCNDKQGDTRRSGLGAAMIEGKSKEHSHFMCYARRLYEAVELVYQPQPDLVESLLKFGKFLSLVGNKGECSIFPHYGHLLFFMEFFLMVDFYFGGKHMRHYLIVPASYASVVKFMDECLAKKKEMTLVEVIKMSSFLKHKHKQVLFDKIRTMTDILIGKKKKGFSLLREVFVLSREWIESGVAERCWILCLTLLSNVSGMVPMWFETDLLQALHDPLPPQTKLPLRLFAAIKSTRRSMGQRDIVKTLTTLLRERNDEQLLVCRWVEDGKKRKAILHLEPLTESDVNELPDEFGTGRWQEDTDSFNDLELQRDELAEREEDLEMSKDEIEKQKTEQIEEKAVQVLVSFFKQICFRERARKLSTYVRNQLEKEVESPKLPSLLQDAFHQYTVDDSMCGICGVQFRPTMDADMAVVGERSPWTIPSSSSATSPSQIFSEVVSGRYRQTRAVHVTSAEHCSRTQEYISLCQYITAEAGLVLEAVFKFLAAKEQSSDLDIGRLSKLKDEVWQELKQLSEHRNWSCSQKLKDLTSDLAKQFQNIIPIQEPYTTSRPKSGIHPRYSDADLLNAELEPVVEEPKVFEGRRARKTKAKKAKRQNNMQIN